MSPFLSYENPRRGFSYDKNGDMHYDIISAFIKSMRGSDPDATVYWLARMIDAALADIHSSGLREVPSYLRDRHRPGSDEYGVYKYPHDYPEGWVDQRYLPEGLERGAFWQPAGRGWEEWRVEQSERDRSGNAPK